MAAPDPDTDAPSPPRGAVPPRTSASWPRLQRHVLRRAGRHLLRSNDRTDSDEVSPPPRQTGGYARWLPVLRTLPWVLGTLFAVSFVWDFPGVRFTVAGYPVVLENLLRFTAVSGLVGFGTNWLAITMLFRPREPRPIVGQGLVPAQRERVAYRLAQAVSDELINKTLIKQKIRESGLVTGYRDRLIAAASEVIASEAVRTETKAILRRVLHDLLSTPAVQDRIVDFAVERVEEQAGDGFSGLALRTYRFFGDADFRARLYEAVEQLPAAVDPLLDEVDPWLDRLPTQIERHGDALEDTLMQILLRLVDAFDVERMIYENVRAYDERQLELLLRRTTNEQLTYIKYLGAVLGIVGGFIIWAPALALVIVTALGLSLYALDEALFRARATGVD